MYVQQRRIVRRGGEYESGGVGWVQWSTTFPFVISFAKDSKREQSFHGDVSSLFILSCAMTIIATPAISIHDHDENARANYY